MMDGSYERVYTVTDYYDGPRSGVASFGGVPHVYRSIWQEQADDWDDDRFELSPLSPEALSLALEDWAIWQRFELAYKTGAVAWSGEETEWGALPSELPRRKELQVALEGALAIDPNHRIVARGEFRPRNQTQNTPLGVMRELEVRWTRV